MDLNSTPKLAPGCRLHPTDSILLIPEGTLNLTGPTREILSKLDGNKNVTTVVTELVAQFEGADAKEIESDVLNVLSRLQQRGVVRA